MRRLSLSTLLIAANGGLVLLTVLCVLAASAALLRRLADDQALARARLAGANALQILEWTSRETTTAARLLSERPTLNRLLGTGDRRGLKEFLDRFRVGSGLSSCELLAPDGKVLARSGEPLPAAASAGNVRDPSSFLLDSGGLLLSGARAPAQSFPATVVVGILLNEPTLQRIAVRTGGPVRVLLAREVLEENQDPRAPARERALRSAEPAVERVDGVGLYLAAMPLRAPNGEIVGVVETGVPTGDVDHSLNRLVRSLLALTLGVAALATLSGFLLGRRLVRPLEILTSASARIGRGDLSTPISRAPGSEAGLLAETMEEMRGRLLSLTAELRRRQAEAEAVLSGIVEGVFSVDRDRRIRYMNPQTASLLGIFASDAIGRFCGDVFQPEEQEGVRPCEDRCPILHARFRGSARATESVLAAEGRRRAVVITSASSAQALSPGGLDHPQFQVLRDETDLEMARRARDAVFANISHEFRTPLAAQLASIELLRDRLGELSLEEVRGLVLSLERGTLRLTQLIDNLLESVRIESGRDSIRRQPVALDEVLEEAVELTGQLIGQRDQRIEMDLPHPLPAVSGDAPRLIQVFVNLLANANKFAPKGSTIRLGGCVSEDLVTLWVEDEGPGLPAGGEALFAPFVRSSGPEPEQGGLGLGLWIVKSIVERHGGRVEAGAGGGVAGSRISVILPRQGDAGETV